MWSAVRVVGLKAALMGFWDFFGLLIWRFLFVMYLMVLFHIFGDLFRDRELGGGAKAMWTIGLILLPFLLMAISTWMMRGRGMSERWGSIPSRRTIRPSQRPVRSALRHCYPSLPTLWSSSALRRTSSMAFTARGLRIFGPM